MGLSQLLESIIRWAQNLISASGYPGLVLVMFLENIFPPIPSEVILPLAGSLVGEGRFTLLGVTLMGALGSVLGAFVFYELGHLLGEARVRGLVQRYGKWLTVSEKDFDTALAWFGRYGEGVIFFARMVPIVRSLVSIPAGIARMALGRFAVYTALGTGLWSFALAFAGHLLGQNWHVVSEWLNRYEKAVAVILIIVVVVFIGRRVLRHRNERRLLAEKNPKPD